jgi:hypothetical protein
MVDEMRPIASVVLHIALVLVNSDVITMGSRITNARIPVTLSYLGGSSTGALKARGAIVRGFEVIDEEP